MAILSPYLMGPAQSLSPMGGSPMTVPATSSMGTFSAPPPVPQQRGLGGFLPNFNMPDQATRLQMAAAMMGGQNFGESLGGAFGVMGQGIAAQRAKREEEQRRNATLEYFKSKRPDLYEAVAVGMDPKEAFKLALEGGPDLTDDLKEYQFARQQGFGGSFTDYMTEMRKAGASTNNITVGGGRYGTIPQGYELIEGPEGATLRAIPGGPEDTSKKDAKAAGQADVATRVVTSAAQRAREAARNRQFGGVGQSVVQNVPWTDSAEVARQVEVLKSTAKVENLTAMRAASPTGGALGSVTEKEADMLAAKSGALDPSSPTFERDLDDYELTLLQVVHGPEAGKRIFDETRRGNAVNDLKTKYGLD